MVFAVAQCSYIKQIMDAFFKIPYFLKN